jgi:hypothetical protein
MTASRVSKAPAEKRIVDAIRDRGGRLEGGSVRRLAKMVRGRRSTVHNAVAGLIAAGIVARVSGQLVLRGGLADTSVVEGRAGVPGWPAKWSD